jgi:hypothetical protein
MRKLVTGLLLLLVSTIGWSGAGPETESPKTAELSLLVYNTHGLPELIAGDKPRERFPKIGELTKGYDLSLLQEDFAHHVLLLQYVRRPADAVQGSDARIPKCIVCSGSGLTLVSNLPKSVWQVRSSFKPFDTCSGWVSGLNDCFAQKGFQLITLENTLGHQILMVNTHLDAGRSELDREARASQLDQIALTLETEAGSSAILLAGDLNLHWETPLDNELLQNFVQRLNLVAAQKGGDVSSGWQTLDYIYYRSSKKTNLSLMSSGEDVAFTSEGKPLSDHPALFANFKIR